MRDAYFAHYFQLVCAWWTVKCVHIDVATPFNAYTHNILFTKVLRNAIGMRARYAGERHPISCALNLQEALYAIDKGTRIKYIWWSWAQMAIRGVVLMKMRASSIQIDALLIGATTQNLTTFHSKLSDTNLFTHAPPKRHALFAISFFAPFLHILKSHAHEYTTPTE